MLLLLLLLVLVQVLLLLLELLHWRLWTVLPALGMCSS